MRAALMAALLLVCGVGTAFAQDEGGGGGRRAAPPGKPNPFAGNQAAIADGAALFGTNCASCHGLMGAGAATGPILASGTRNDTVATDESLFKMIKAGVPGTIMPGWDGKMSDDDIWKVAAYIKGLRGPAINAPVPGDVVHGEEIFFGKGQYGNCHMVKGRGGMSGPELSNIATGRKVANMVDALTKPKHHIYGFGSAHIRALTALDSYLPVKVVPKSGKPVNGTLMNESVTSLQILGDDGELHLLDRADVRSMTVADKSPMPTDYDKRLTPVEFNDLLAFLSRQSTRPQPAAR